MTVSFVSVLILWSGDFSAPLSSTRWQFDGPLNTEIKGELVEENNLQNKSSQARKNCDMFAQFNESNIKEKNQLEKYIQISFKFVCTQDGQIKNIKIAPEFVRYADLKTHSSTVFISDRFKKNTFQIEEYSTQISKAASGKK